MVDSAVGMTETAFPLRVMIAGSGNFVFMAAGYANGDFSKTLSELGEPIASLLACDEEKRRQECRLSLWGGRGRRGWQWVGELKTWCGSWRGMVVGDETVKMDQRVSN